MKKYLIPLICLLPLQTLSADQSKPDNVYSWGHWAESIQPGAGPGLSLAPAPVQAPNVHLRPNESAKITRTQTQIIVALPQPAAPVVPGAPQLPVVVTAPVNTPSADSSGLNPGGTL